MSKYQELREKIAKLEAEAEAARNAEMQEAVSDIKAKIKAYGLTASDLGFAGFGRTGKAKGAVPAKYRDPATGNSWTGRGRAPKWIAEHEASGGSRQDFAL